MKPFLLILWLLMCFVATFSAGYFMRDPTLPDSTFVTTNGTVSVVINGHRQTLAYDATNMVVRTKRGARITTEFKP